MGRRIEEIDADLAAAVRARLRILESQEYTIGNGVLARRNRRAELAQVSALITELQRERARAEAGSSGPRRVHYVRGF